MDLKNRYQTAAKYNRKRKNAAFGCKMCDEIAYLSFDQLFLGISMFFWNCKSA